MAPGTTPATCAENRSGLIHLYDRERAAMCVYWGSGHGMTQEENMAWTNENFTYGLNMYNTHGGLYGSLGSWYEWVPPSVHFRQPYFELWQAFVDYVSRLSAVMSQGRHVADVALLYPLTSMHANWLSGKRWALAVGVFALLAGCDPAPRSLTVEVKGREFQWYIRYPGPDGRLGTADDIRALGDLHLPVHTKATIRLASDDYVYTLSLPHIRAKEIAVPEMNFSIAFETGSAGVFELLGDQLCGYAHQSLITNLVVQSRADFEAWLNQRQSKAEVN